ncbi:hypothetical protein Halha_0936 [Halobacteroides halobius DSM 5150]|uniref:Uncharacterized protein n=1 Tax=Halobacteroides halobius (strain ATCC 35273 / DSM 5150 / MD-1) TaxID=748449 RepID=L0K6L4_HALHC|nr:hypothetical protein [Halobacteroides halobius]AGB40897.1 hypothetical protein Halha_0936 [Halobacteroides halobius DSM 5150]
MKSKNYIILILVLLVFLSTSVLAKVEVGGEVESKIRTLINDQGSDSFLLNKINLNFLLPANSTTEAKFAVNLFSNRSDYQVKKLYLAHYFPKFDLTIGRQPISWSFGSLLNPVDFNLGAETMGEKREAKVVDAVEIYYPVNWNTGLTGVASFSQQGQVKEGLRARTYYKGYDLSANYIKDYQGNRRFGISGKGDLGPVGIYGAIAYYSKAGVPVYLVGVDYSFQFNDFNKLTLQGEYLRNEAGSYIGLGDQLVAGFANYKINNFSNFSSYMIVSLSDDLTGMLAGSYQKQLGTNLDFELSTSITKNNNQVTKVIEMSFSYPF